MSEQGYSSADGFYIGDRVKVNSLGHVWDGRISKVKGSNSHSVAVHLFISDVVIWTKDYNCMRVGED